MARNYISLKACKPNKIFRASANDLKIKNTTKPHDVIVLSVNKKYKTARVKTITSLEFEDNGKFRFDNEKLDKVRSGEIVVVPKKELNTHKLCGINNNVKTIKVEKLYTSTTGSKFPKRFKDVIKRFNIFNKKK